MVLPLLSPVCQAQLTTTTDYQYSSTHLQVTKERTPQSDGSVLETQYTYPPDYTNGPYAALQALVQQNIITPVIQKKVIREMGSSRDVISAQIITYKLWSVGGKQVPLPYKVYSLLINSPLSEGLFTDYAGNSPDFTTLGTSTTYQVEIEYTDYDEKGNLQSLLSKGNQKTSYLWGYNGQYPIAEIQNANKTEVDAALSAAGTSRSDISALTSDAQLQTKFTSIQNALQSIPALLKGYTYRVGVGMASMTDVMGKVTAYQYDGLSRLAEIRENNASGSLIQSFGYHYQGQGLDNATSVSTSPGVTVPATPSLTGGTSTNCNFTISTSPTASAGCGGTVTLSASCSGNDCSGVVYSWSGPNSFTGSSSSVNVTAPSTAGSYTYTVTASKSGCTSQQKQVTLTVSCGGTCNYTNNQLLGSTSGKDIYVKVVGNCKYIAFEPGGETRALDWLYVLVNNGGWASGVTPLTSDQIPVCFKQPGESCPGGCSTPGAPNVSASATSINSGQSSTLTASNCSGTVSWSSGQSGSSIQVSPTATTTYTATCTVGSCSSPASSGVTVTVNPPASDRLVVASISGISGQASTKKRVTISNPYSGNRTYLWYIYRDSDMQYISNGPNTSSSNGIFDVDLASYNLVSGTVYRLYVGDTGDSGNSRHGYNTFTIGSSASNCAFTVSTPSTASAGCGGTVTLSASCSGNDCSGVVYSWSGPNSFTGSSSSVNVTAPSTAGSYTYTVTASKSGCTSQQKQVTLTVSCGGTCNYTNNQLLGSTSGKDIYVKVVGNCKYIAFEPGGETRALDWLYVLVNNGGWASGVTPLTSDQIPVCFKQPGESCPGGCSTPGAPNVSASATSINSGQSSTLTASNCSGTVSWSSGQSGSSIQVSPTATTTYTATCTVGSCSSPASSGVTVTVNPPASDRLVVASISGISGQASTKKRVTISNPYSGNRTYLWYIYRDSDMQYISNGPNTSSSNGIFDVDLASYNLVSGTVYRLYVGDTGDSGNSRHGYNTFTIGSSASNCAFTVSTPSTASAGCGGTVTLSASCSGNDCSGVVYSWSGPNSFTGSSSSVNVTAPSTAGSYTYTVTASKSGCTSQQKQVTLTVSCGGTGQVSQPYSSVDGGDCTSIWGWAFDGGNTQSSVSLDVYINGTKTATIPTNVSRADVASYYGTGSYNMYGFSYSIPASVKNGTQLSVSLKFAGTQTELSGSPKVIGVCQGSGGCATGAPSVSASATSITSGQKVTLSASGCSGTVTWSNGQTGSSLVVRPAASMQYTATCSANGCTSSASATVSIQVTTSIAAGCYRIQGFQSEKYLQDRGLNTQLQQYTSNGQNNQLWKVESVGSGLMKIISTSSGYGWDIDGASQSDGAILKLYSYGGGSNQQFGISYVNDEYGGFRVTPSHASNKCVEIGGFSVSDGGNAAQQGYAGNGNQRWVFVPATCPAN